MKSGFFKLEDILVINGMVSLQEAKDFCNGKIDSFKSEHSDVKTSNVEKAQRMVALAKSKIQLMNGVKDFAFAHPSENLKVM